MSKRGKDEGSFEFVRFLTMSKEEEDKGLDRIPSDKELSLIARNIGHGWQMLAVYLGIDHTQVDQIEQDYRSTTDRIFRLLIRWKQFSADGATLRELFYQMHHTGQGLNWNREGIAFSLNLTESDIKDCKNARTQRDFKDYGGKPSVVVLENPENKLENPEKKLGNPEKKLENQENKLENPEKKLEYPENKLENTENKLENPEDKLNKNAKTNPDYTDYGGNLPEIVLENPENKLGDLAGIPFEIQSMDKESIEIYKQALAKGSEKVKNIRLMIVGHFCVGKTVLTKRLINESYDIETRIPTEGIDIHIRKVAVNLEDGTWKSQGEADEKEKYLLRNLQVLKDFLSKKDNDDRPSLKEVYQHPESDSKDANEKMMETRDPTAGKNVNLQISNEIENKADNRDSKLTEELKSVVELGIHSFDVRDQNLAEISVWDFAGQYSFYDTHKVFLSRRTIYLLVTDLSNSPDDTVEHDNCYIDIYGNRQWKVSEFANFWLNTIHAYNTEAGQSYEESSAGSENTVADEINQRSQCPPVILVGTFADKLKDREEGEVRLKQLEDSLKNYSNYERTASHLLKERFVIDNVSKTDMLEDLRKVIVETAKKQSYWGELIPARWIKLENELYNVKISGIQILSKERLERINRDMDNPITPEQLNVFLRFHHECGNIIYFSDDEKLNKTIVLNPQWLIDAFKILHPQRDFFTQKRDIFEKWNEFEKYGILPKSLIDEIWQHEDTLRNSSTLTNNSAEILNYLERLGLLVPAKPEKDTLPFFFAPSFVKETVPPDFLIPQCNEITTSKLCFTTVTGDLPSAVFQKILVSFLEKYDLESSERFLKYSYPLFCGCGIFRINDGEHTLFVIFCENAIQVWLSRMKEEPSPKLCQEVKTFIESKLPKYIVFKQFLKCPQSRYVVNDGGLNIESEVVGTKIQRSCTLTLNSEQLKQCWNGSQTQPTDTSAEKNTRSSRSRGRFTYNGRLVELQSDEKNKIAKGCGGTTVFAVLRKIKALKCEGFGMELAIRQVKIDDQIKKKCVQQKLNALRHRHPFILPTFAIFGENKSFYFLSPFCQNGDLQAVLNSTSHTLSEAQRIRIALQIALAIEFLHTPVRDSAIVHGNISTTNIVLDEEFNARLIDFKKSERVVHKSVDALNTPEATEPSSTTSVIRTDTEASPESKKIKEDFEGFGQVVVELLTDSFADKESKAKSTLDEVVKSCKGYTTIEMFRKQVIEKLKELLNKEYGHYKVMVRKNDTKCDVCIINEVAYKVSETKHVSCMQRMKICTACDFNSYCIPVKCFSCGVEQEPFIGKHWGGGGAILIAGDGTGHEAFKKDVESLKNEIHTGRTFPIKKDDVESIFADEHPLRQKLQSALEKLKTKSLRNLLIYFSCHGKSGKQSSGDVQKENAISRSNSVCENKTITTGTSRVPEDEYCFLIGPENLSVNALAEELQNMKNVETFVIILDRCFAPIIKLNTGNVMQFNSSGSQQTSGVTLQQSIFTKYFIKALKAERCQDNKECAICNTVLATLEGYLSVPNVFDYIYYHMEKESENQKPCFYNCGSKVHFACNISSYSECDINKLENTLNEIEC